LIIEIFTIHQSKSNPSSHEYHNHQLFCGERRNRTSEGISQQIYSLPQLTALVSPLILSIADVRLKIASIKKELLFNHRLATNNYHFAEPMDGFEPPTC
jgi:hypothetical protein